MKAPAQAAPTPSDGILVLTGGLIHLVQQLAVANSLAPDPSQPVAITVLITGVLRKQPEALAAMHVEIERWLAALRHHRPQRFGQLRLARDPDELQPNRWSLALVNNQWLESQRQVARRLAIPEMVVCGDGLGVYYRCARELRALLPSLLDLPIAEAEWRVRYALHGRQPRWHRPPSPPLPVPVAFRQELFTTLVDALRERGATEVGACLRHTSPERSLWLCSMPNLAHQFPGQRLPGEVLAAWGRGLEREGFTPELDRLLLIDHPKAPPDGSFGPLQESWLAPPLRSSLPLEVLIQLLREARPAASIVVCGMTSALYGVRELTGVRVSWLSMAPLWRHNPLYRRKPVEFLHRALRKARMAWLTRHHRPASP